MQTLSRVVIYPGYVVVFLSELFALSFLLYLISKDFDYHNLLEGSICILASKLLSLFESFLWVIGEPFKLFLEERDYDGSLLLIPSILQLSSAYT